MEPSWILPIVDAPDRLGASISLARAFMSASAADRAAVRRGWPFGVAWEYPSPWRLACTVGEPGTSRERIVTSLVLNALEDRTAAREETILHCVAYNSCKIAGIAPDALLLEVAETLPADKGTSLKAFVARDAQDQSLESFLLETKLSPDGELEIRPTW